jgi:tRNA pseudouridine65 synthase
MQIPIIYQDQHFLVVYKPSGLLVHRSPIDKNETQFLMQAVRDQIGQYVYTVHRLDKPTSGLIILALNPDIARLLSAQLEEHKIKKGYHALVRGYIHETQRIDYPLVEQLDKMTDDLNKDNPAKPAISDVKPLAHAQLPFALGAHATARFSLVELNPLTGRKHQLRRHLRHIFHPIIGDTTHGDGKQNRYMQAHVGISRLALCATSLQFNHPVTDQALHIQCKLDDSLLGLKQILTQYCTWQDDDFSLEDLI